MCVSWPPDTNGQAIQVLFRFKTANIKIFHIYISQVYSVATPLDESGQVLV